MEKLSPNHYRGKKRDYLFIQVEVILGESKSFVL